MSYGSDNLGRRHSIHNRPIHLQGRISFYSLHVVCTHASVLAIVIPAQIYSFPALFLKYFPLYRLAHCIVAAELTGILLERFVRRLDPFGTPDCTKASNDGNVTIGRYKSQCTAKPTIRHVQPAKTQISLYTHLVCRADHTEL